MADTNETIADIIAWLRRPREGENAYLTLWRNEIADRIEAALLRELSKICPKSGGDFGQLGEVAKLRDALEKAAESASEIMERVRHKDGLAFNTANYIAGIAKAALAAPPRNCDRFVSAEQAWDAYDEWVESYRSKGKTEPFNEFGWLFAPATEQEGGDDGK